MAGAISSLLNELSLEVHSLSSSGGTVPRVQGPISPLDFLRDYVAQNRPCVVQGSIPHWPALSLWRDDEYLTSALGGRSVHVDFTPDGRGDAVVALNHLNHLTQSSQLNQLNQMNHLNKLSKLRECSPISGSELRTELSSEFELPGRNEASESSWEDANEIGGRTCDGSAVSDQSRQDRNEERNGRDEHDQSASGEETHSHDLRMSQRDKRSHSERHTDSRNPGIYRAETETGTKAETEAETETERETGPHIGSDSDSTAHWFVTPFETLLTYPEFLSSLRDSRHTSGIGVPYVQHQNSSLTSDFSILSSDVADGVSFATSAFGAEPEATNLWIGDERAETSWHKDHYENLYAVVSGQKHFRLLPPCDLPRMCMREYKAAHYWRPQPRSGAFHIVPDTPTRTVPWASVDSSLRMLPGIPEAPCTALRSGVQPLCCTLDEGDVLYLPAMWFHHVTQTPDESGRTVAVNFWYDMAFDSRYAYYKMVEGLTKI